MISVSEALEIIKTARLGWGIETVSLVDAIGAQAAQDIVSNVTMPPFDASAMDGYAVQLEDVGNVGAKLEVIGEAPAGSPFKGCVNSGQAVRIFTGSPLPKGANHILIQENATREGDRLSVNEASDAARHIRFAGIDFSKDDILIPKGKTITAPDIALAAAGNHASVQICKRPKVAIIASGDELREPGSDLKDGQIISSNSLGLAALIRDWGADPHIMGIAKDSVKSIRTLIDAAEGADIFLPIGGASVGDYDFMKAAFKESGFETAFEKIAVRPGKPTWFGTRGKSLVLGLPGNPASAYVCAHVFLRTLISGPPILRKLPLKNEIKANGPRETFLRGCAEIDATGQAWVTAFPKQDSSLITPLAQANVLLRLPAAAGPWGVGDMVEVLSLGTGPDVLAGS